MYDKLKIADTEIYSLICEEEKRQRSCIELIASENFTSVPVMECLGSILTNKYSEGQPNQRYYGGNEVIDKIELLCKDRALHAFNLSADDWYVNVQPYSGTPANFAVYTALLNPQDRIMGLDLPSGGHLSHGYYTATGKKISATSIYFQSMPYKVDAETGLIDYDDLEMVALRYRPALIIAGASAYPRYIDFSRFRKICDLVGAILFADIAHISGLVATGEHPNPFTYCDVVTSTSHKTLRGPRAGLIWVNKTSSILTQKFTKTSGILEAIDQAVFPGIQGGPHNHQIAGLAVQLAEVASPSFKEYCINVKRNCVAFCDECSKQGLKVVTSGSDNHLCLIDLRPIGLSGSKVEKACDFVGITLNRNTVHGDRSALTPGGVRIGTPAMTTRGVDEDGFRRIAVLLRRVVDLAVRVQNESSSKKLVDFENSLRSDKFAGEFEDLRREVASFASVLKYPQVNSHF